MLEKDLTRAAGLLATARSICVSTGAGMSVESGLETFRGDDGLWSKVRIEEMATPEAFARDPVKVWAWYRHRRAKLAAIAPHEGHRVLARWERRAPDFTLVTQNIDGLHHRAGSSNVLELHGRLDVARCTYCDYQVQTLDDLGPEPACPVCMKRLRPAVVWFGEILPQDALAAAFAAAARCDVFVIIGTSGVVQPAASLVEIARHNNATHDARPSDIPPEHGSASGPDADRDVALPGVATENAAAHRDDAGPGGGRRGAWIIEINPNPSEFTPGVDIFLRAGCRAALTALDAAWPTT